jgi:hypothetical protein
MFFIKGEYNLMNINNNDEKLLTEEIGCGFCWDSKKKKDKELFFLDKANNMRICNYCPSCGRKYNEE